MPWSPLLKVKGAAVQLRMGTLGGGIVKGVGELVERGGLAVEGIGPNESSRLSPRLVAGRLSAAADWERARVTR